MREISLKKIQNNFKESNNKIKININNYLVHKFTDDYNKVLSKEELFNYIFNLFESIYTAYLKSNDLKEKIKLSQENKDLLKTMTNIQDYITNFIIHYEKNSKIIVDSISQKKSIEFLDQQVRKEKKEFERCLNNKNKSTKEDFKYIIETFLNDNFYYISQKYLIYRVFTDVCETISDRIEIEVNEIIKDLLDKKNPKDLLIKIYNQKFKDLEERINKYRKDDNKIYNHKENKSIVHNNLPTNIKENIHKSYKPGISDLAPIPTIK